MEATDIYCGGCGQLLFEIDLRAERWTLLESISTARQTTIVVRNSDSRKLRIEVRPRHQRPWITHHPERLTIPAGQKGGLTFKLEDGGLPTGFREERLRYELVVNGDERIVRAFEIKVLGAPKAQAPPIQFGQLEEGTTRLQNLCLTNSGGTPLRVETLSAQGSRQLKVEAIELPAQVNPDETLSIPVTWDTREPEDSPASEVGFLLQLSQGEPLFVPAIGKLYRYRLTLTPNPLRLDGSPRGEMKHEIVLTNRGTIDVEITAIRACEPWIKVSPTSFPLALPAPADPSKISDLCRYRFTVSCTPGLLDPGLHRGSVEVLTAGELEGLSLSVELRARPLEHYGDYLGIDFGTTNSVVAVVNPDNEEIELVSPSVPGVTPSPLIPSVLVFTGDDGSHVIGNAGKREMETRPGQTVRSIKRIMGYAEQWEGPDRAYRPQELAALILKQLVALAARKLFDSTGSYYDVKRAIVTVPASFYDLQSQGILEACELAGLAVEHDLGERAAETLRRRVGVEINNGIVLDEPSAAALFLLHHLAENRSLAADLDGLIGRDSGMHLLVFDYGGGTLDISVAQVSTLEDGSRGLRILANCGDNRIGGDQLDFLFMSDFLDDARARFPDFDPTLISASHRKIQRRREIDGWSDSAWNGVSAARLRWKDRVERLKIQLSSESLSDDDEVSVEVPAHAICHLGDGELVTASAPVELLSTRRRMESRLEPTLATCDHLVEQALDLAQIQAEEVDFVFHAGRQSLMPVVRRKVAELFPEAENAQRILLDESLIKVCVAKGAALYGLLRNQPEGEETIRLVEERRLPHAYGVTRTVGLGRLEFEEIIARGESIPVEREKVYGPGALPASGRLRLRLYQNTGKSRRLRGNPEIRRIGEIEHVVSAADDEPLTVRFAVDVNRRLIVHVADRQVEVQPFQPTDEMEWMG